MGKIGKIAIMVVIQGALAFALAVYVAGPAMRGERMPWQKSPEAQAAADSLSANEVGPLLPIEEVLVNIAGTKGRRFFKTSISLEMDGKDLEKIATERLPILRGKVIDVLAAKPLEDLISPNARDALRVELLESLNAEVSGGEFTDLFFTEFLVQ